MKNQSENSPFSTKFGGGKARNRDLKFNVACNSTPKGKKSKNHENLSPAFQKLYEGNGINSIRIEQPNSSSGNTKENDKNRSGSRKKLKLQCSEHRKFVTDSYKNRVLTPEQRQMFDALLGIHGKYADHMPASDIKLRRFMGKRIIDEMHQLWQRAQYDSRLKVYLVTFLDDAFHMNERTGTAEPVKFMHKVQAVIRQYTNFNAFGVIENQALTNYPKGSDGKTLSIHAHVVCWGYNEDDHQKLLDHAKGFKSAITKKPIHFEGIQSTEGDFTTVGRYLAKPPSEGKVINYNKLEQGHACLSSIREGMKKYHHLRLFEYGAKLPMEHTIFGVQEGVPVRQRIVNKMTAYQKSRFGTEIPLGSQVNDLFKVFLESNKLLKNYQPVQVNYKRDQK